MKYRKKPVAIEAIQFNGQNQEDIILWAGSVIERTPAHYVDQVLLINTLEGQMTAQINDYVIKGVKGEFYPVKPDIFDATYEKV